MHSLNHLPCHRFFLTYPCLPQTCMYAQQNLDTDTFHCFCYSVASETACTMKTETCFELERRKDATRKLTKRKRHFLKRFPFLESPTRYLLYTGKSDLS